MVDWVLKVLAFLFVVLLFGLPFDLNWVRAASASETEVLCTGWEIRGHLDRAFTPIEKRLVCGEGKAAMSLKSEGWQTIPLNQAQYNLANFLQDRGYFHPVFHVVDSKVIVVLGEPAHVKHVSIEGTPEGKDYLVDTSRMRNLMGAVITPTLLNTLEKWVFTELRREGYACPQVTSEADATTGLLTVKVQMGPEQNILDVSQEEIPATVPGLLRRYDAFHLGEKFNGNLLVITENRVSSASPVQNSHFITHCLKSGVILRQTVLAGSPHILTAGVGINTEGLLLGRVSWKNSRLGNLGSLIDISAFASSKLQSVVNQANWYFLPEVSRLYFNPLLRFSHRNETYYEDLSARLQYGLASTGDYRFFGTHYFLGPTLDFFKLLRGVGAPDLHLLSLEGQVDLKSYEYEYYASDPRSGYSLSFITDFSHQAIDSDITAQRLNLRGESLWNLDRLDPPLLILGVRGGFATVIINSLSASVPSSLPASLLQYLGGSSDLRGFGRQELAANSTVGGLSSAFLGTELRLSHTLPFGIDPFVFGDVGALGTSPLSFDSPVYWSPGCGIRWASPIGPVRTTLAYGFANGIPRHLQFFLSLGEEF